MTTTSNNNTQQSNKLVTQHKYVSSFKTKDNTNFKVSYMHIYKDPLDRKTPKYRMFVPMSNRMILASDLSYLVPLLYNDELESIISSDIAYTKYSFEDFLWDVADSDEDLYKYVENAISSIIRYGPFVSAWGKYPFIIEKIEGYHRFDFEFMNDEVDEYVAKVHSEFISNLRDYVKHTVDRRLASPTREVVENEARCEEQWDMYDACRP